MSKKKERSPVRKIRKKIKDEIRKRYERGEDLLQLAHEYKLHYGTLRNCSSLESWSKGCIAEIVYLQEQEEEIEELVEEREKVKKALRGIYKTYLNEQVAEARQGGVKSKAQEEALLMREKRLAVSIETGTKLYNIRTELEEKEFEIVAMKVDEARIELSKLQEESKEQEEEFEG